MGRDEYKYQMDLNLPRLSTVICDARCKKKEDPSGVASKVSEV